MDDVGVGFGYQSMTSFDFVAIAIVDAIF